jgi:hypothetical protein
VPPIDHCERRVGPVRKSLPLALLQFRSLGGWGLLSAYSSCYPYSFNMIFAINIVLFPKKDLELSVPAAAISSMGPLKMISGIV